MNDKVCFNAGYFYCPYVPLDGDIEINSVEVESDNRVKIKGTLYQPIDYIKLDLIVEKKEDDIQIEIKEE